MIKLEYTAQPSPFGDLPDVLELKMTLSDNVSWDEATQEFHNFLRGAGYVIPYNLEWHLDYSDPPDRDKSGSLGDRQPEWANSMSGDYEWVGLDDNGDCVTRPYPFSPQMIKRERESMRKKCIVKDCENHTDQGGFTGDLCNPCHAFITEGNGVYSQVYRNAQREWVGLEGFEFADLAYEFVMYDEGCNEPWFDRRGFAEAIEAKLKERNT